MEHTGPLYANSINHGSHASIVYHTNSLQAVSLSTNLGHNGYLKACFISPGFKDSISDHAIS
jgi:hypothetical protein